MKILMNHLKDCLKLSLTLIALRSLLIKRYTKTVNNNNITNIQSWFTHLAYVYLKVAMGQGQAEIAMQLLKDCSRDGDWLCLKNLHLVTAWLPALEKELNTMQAHDSFRLWLTAEAHPKFPTILLQSSLKITYEVMGLLNSWY